MKKLLFVTLSVCIVSTLSLILMDIIVVDSFLKWFATITFLIIVPSIFLSMNISFAACVFFNYNFKPLFKENNESKSYWNPGSYVGLGKKSNKDNDSFTKSAAIGYITKDPIIGGTIGGDYIGGIFGSELNDN